MLYLSVSGKAEIVYHSDDNGIAEVHIKLLEKFPYYGPPNWIKKTIEKIKNNKEQTWTIGIIPEKLFIAGEL